MKKLILILCISNFIFAQNAHVDTNSILIGEHIVLSISNQLKLSKNWPVYNDTIVKGLEVIHKSEIDTTDNIVSQKFIITSWDTGSYYIPPYYFSKNTKTNALTINVQTLKLEENAKLKDIKRPIKEPLGWSDIWPWILVLCALVFIYFLLKKYYFNKDKNSVIKNTKIDIPADVIALEELEKLEKEEIWQKGKIKDYYSRLSEITRRYLEDRYMFIALELTSDEIIKEMNERLDSKLKKQLEMLLIRSDLAKFAKSKPNEKENIESMLIAKDFIVKTKKDG